ncbi:MAG: 50S ribosomal protein L9 [Candidatus Omnitrophica bacterium]|nr:50S ribosomal protein L9 [Candidatus Omnitrophota bacterium]
MKVILIEDIEKLGKANEVIEVKDGFARNYLFPYRKAILATAENLRCLEEEKKRKLKQIEKKRQETEELAKRLDGMSVNVLVKVNENGELYGSVTAQQISEAIRQEGFEVDKKYIILKEPIRKLGVFECLIRFSTEIEAKIKVWVVKQ